MVLQPTWTCSSFLMPFIQKACRAVLEIVSSPQMLDGGVSLEGKPFSKGGGTDLQLLSRSERARISAGTDQHHNPRGEEANSC